MNDELWCPYESISIGLRFLPAAVQAELSKDGGEAIFTCPTCGRQIEARSEAVIVFDSWKANET